MGGSAGQGHSRDFMITDSIRQYIVPAKALAVTVVDLLYDDAVAAKNVIDGFVPTIKRDEYSDFMKTLVE
jgi:hypothetical protein